MKLELTADQWDRYLKKYGNLMHKISRMIGGDTIIASPEDNFSELCMAALESINGFHKKTGKNFEEMFPMKLFDQYTKTCLWTTKARKGTPISNRMPFRSKHISIDTSDDKLDTYCIEDTSAATQHSLMFVMDLLDTVGSDEKKIMKAILEDPDVLTNDGHLNLSAIDRKTGISDYKSRIAITKLKGIVSDESN